MISSRNLLLAVTSIGLMSLSTACDDEPPTSTPGKDMSADASLDASIDLPLDASNDAPTDTPSDLSQDQQVDLGTCAGDACLYQPLKTYNIDPDKFIDATVEYMDLNQKTRRLNIQIRRPTMPTQPVPVVIWSHGGASGKDQPARVAEEWGEVFNHAGYVSVHIAHVGRSSAEILEQCAGIGVRGCDQACTADEQCTEYPGGGCPGENQRTCAYYKPLNWDRPHDVEAVLRWLAVENKAAGRFAGALDLDRVAYAGHSAGAGGTFMAAGASRTYGDVTTEKTIPGIKAFISCSPQGPGEDGFVVASYDGSRCAQSANPDACLSRPHLILTGAGDDTGTPETGSVAENRQSIFGHLPAGNKYMAYINDEAARHVTFDHSTSACERYAMSNGLERSVCLAHVKWLDSAMLAFLDAHLKDDPKAKAYLASDRLSTASAGVLEWSAK